MPILLITAIVLGLAGYILARAKGRDRFLWTVLCFLFGIPVIILIFLPKAHGLGAARAIRTSLSRTDEAKWKSLVELDVDIAAAAAAARKLGDRYERLLAEKYMPLNDKAYLAAALEKVSQQAQIEESEPDELLRLRLLMEAGLLTESEFGKQKSALLIGETHAKWIRLSLAFLWAACLIINSIIFRDRDITFVFAILSAIFAVLYVSVSAHEYAHSAEITDLNIRKYTDALITLASIWISTLLYAYGSNFYSVFIYKDVLFEFAFLRMIPALVPVAIALVAGNALLKTPPFIMLSSVFYVAIYIVLIVKPYQYLLYGTTGEFDIRTIALFSFILSVLLPARYFYVTYMRRSLGRVAGAVSA